jgi:hypothetical protein
MLAACEDEQRIVCGTVADCPGDPTCVDIQCTGHICKFNDYPDQSSSPANVTGDCKQIVCDGHGGFYVNVDMTDLPTASGQCQLASCSAEGKPSVGPAQAGTSCGTGLFCDNGGACVGCLTPLQCPGTDTECHARTCVNGTCGMTNAAAGTLLVNGNPKGDCHQVECDGSGGTMTVVDDTDKPANVCKFCSTGTITNRASGFSCGTSSAPLVCDGNGTCGQCNQASDCPGASSDTDCNFHTCNSHVCATTKPPSGTPTTTNPPQVAGDCHEIQCNGNGGLLSPTPIDNADVPNDNNSCTSDTCTSGVAANTVLTDGTVCADSGSPGTRCRTGVCVPAFSVVRAGDGTNALSSSSAQLQIEERFASDGALVAGAETTNPISLPIAASGSTQACTNAGLAGGGAGMPPLEGFLVRSVDEHYATLACYNAAPLTATISGTAASTTNRVVARLDKSQAVDTTTVLNAAFSGNSVRSAITTNGTDIWVSGSETGANGTGGAWYTTVGATGGTQITDNPTTIRVLHSQGGQLMGTSGGPTGFAYVFAIGSGEPTTAGQVCTALPGMPGTTGAGTSPNPLDYAFVTVGSTPTLYITDNRTGLNGGGIEKYTFDGTNWNYVTTFNGLPSVTPGMYAITAYVSSGNVIVLATSNTVSGNLVVSYTDDGASTPTPTTLATAPSNTGYRGISLAPH